MSAVMNLIFGNVFQSFNKVKGRVTQGRKL